MSRYFVSFIVASLLYLPLLYLLFFYKPPKKSEPEHTPLKISSFQTEEETEKPQEAPPKKKPEEKKLPKKLYPTKKETLEKFLPKTAQNQVEETKEENNTTKVAQKEKKEDFVKANPLSVDELNSLFESKPKKASKEERKLKNLYGEGYESLTENEKEYLKKNISTIGAVTQKYLQFPYLAAKLKMSGKNMVEFYLSPNGDISEIKLVDSSGYTLLDDNSIETIELAHKEYPYPEEKTRVRIYVDYLLD